MKEHIWDPLGMKSTTFRIFENEDIRNRLCPMTRRTGHGVLKPAPPYRRYDMKDDYGGQGICCSPNDFIKLLGTVLKNDGTLLKQQTVEAMFQPQLADNKYLKARMDDKVEGDMLRCGVKSDAWNFGLGGILNMEDVEGLCRKGTMTWGGYANTYWVSRQSCTSPTDIEPGMLIFLLVHQWIDPLGGTCGFYASQLVSPGDVGSRDLALAFRRHVYRDFAST